MELLSEINKKQIQNQTKTELTRLARRAHVSPAQHILSFSRMSDPVEFPDLETAQLIQSSLLAKEDIDIAEQSALLSSCALFIIFVFLWSIHVQ